ncbi:DUF6090 family protein [Winogradskyella wandonensis]|nr:DUF6090 family protein [Winogradskyella wandonensis]
MGKYFKYAIGEIILVVIGILIALQINNWNENRKDRLLIQSYYKQLLDELDSDVSTIKFSISRLQNDIEAYNNLKKETSNPNLSIDSVLIYHQNAVFDLENTTFNTKTVSVMQSTGDIRLLPSHIRNALINLENEQKSHLDDFKGRLDLYLAIFKELDFLETFSDLDIWKNNKALSNRLNIQERQLEELPVLIKALKIKNISNKRNKLELNNILNYTEELIRFIKKEMD